MNKICPTKRGSDQIGERVVTLHSGNCNQQSSNWLRHILVKR